MPPPGDGWRWLRRWCPRGCTCHGCLVHCALSCRCVESDAADVTWSEGLAFGRGADSGPLAGTEPPPREKKAPRGGTAGAVKDRSGTVVISASTVTSECPHTFSPLRTRLHSARSSIRRRAHSQSHDGIAAIPVATERTGTDDCGSGWPRSARAIICVRQRPPPARRRARTRPRPCICGWRWRRAAAAARARGRVRSHARGTRVRSMSTLPGSPSRPARRERTAGKINFAKRHRDTHHEAQRACTRTQQRSLSDARHGV